MGVGSLGSNDGLVGRETDEEQKSDRESQGVGIGRGRPWCVGGGDLASSRNHGSSFNWG